MEEQKRGDRRHRQREAQERAAAERLSTPDQLDQVIHVARFPYWLTLGAIALVLVGGVVAAFVVPIPVTVHAEGILINVDGIQTVTSHTEGRLESLLVSLGTNVEAGQVVARVDQPRLRRQLADRRAELAEAESRREKIRAFHRQTSAKQTAAINNQLQALRKRYEAAELRVEILEKRLVEDRGLLEGGIISKRQLADSETDLGDARNELLSIQGEQKAFEQQRTDQDLARQRELLESELQIRDLERQAASLEEELNHRSLVKSPYAGRVVELKVNEGEIVTSHVALFSLLPPEAGDAAADGGGGLVAVLYVPPAEGKKVRPGMSVQLAPSAVKREEFGFMLGEVKSVAEVPSTTAGMMRILQNIQLVEQLSRDHAPFQVVVRPLRDESTVTGYAWSSSEGPAVEINVGTLCSGDVITRRELAIQILLPVFGRLTRERPAP